ncbi:MAG: ubiquinone biosynthesis regulatory protein kinase UbiB [Gammaproteobacteria bacterium]|nr:ubiquinone biosynthesis regulatory protein kinase UbiB [Gammaproteobacteria bacterium]MCY4275166.1 ubiquinone biosynthesis regulatory protein kinase UbiB [Gammaproteobacteria bacterium]
MRVRITIKDLFRVLRIVRVCIKHGLDEFVHALQPLRPYAFLFRLLPKKSSLELSRGERLTRALKELGPVFIKFGQVLSTRPDLIPEDISKHLAELQDRVEPFPTGQVISIIESAFGASIDTQFKNFEQKSAAAASVAQVHFATLHDDTDVVVKLIRPEIKKTIDRDLALMWIIAKIAEIYWPKAKRFRPMEIVADYQQTIYDELDLMREAASTSQFSINFKDSTDLYVPKIYWHLTSHEVMVMERINGIPIRNIDKLIEAGIDLQELAERGVEIFFTQALSHGFFHADMHPGNIFVLEDGRYCAVDFGIMGTLSISDKRYLAENLLAFFNRDYRRVAEAHIMAGWVPSSTNVEHFESAIRTVCEPIFAKPISEISFGSFFLDLLRVARRFEMPLQPQLILLQKTIFNIEGLGRQLYPDLNLWTTAKPFLEKWTAEQIGPQSLLKTMRRELPYLVSHAPEIPGLMHQLLYKFKNNEMTINTQDIEIRNLNRSVQQMYRAIVMIAFGMFILAFLSLFPNFFTTIVNTRWGGIALFIGIVMVFLAISLRRPLE